MDTDCLRQVLDQVRENPSNQVCADCGMEGKIRLLWIRIVYDRCWTKSGKTPVTRCVLTVEWKVGSHFIIPPPPPPQTKLGGVYWNHPVRLSFCQSVDACAVR